MQKTSTGKKTAQRQCRAGLLALMADEWDVKGLKEL